MIIILITFFLIFTLICVKNIRYGVYAVIFSMPLYLVRFSIGGIPSTALEMMIYILFLVWFFGRIRKNNFYPALAGFNRLCKNNFVLSIGIALLFLGLTISTFNSTDLRTSFGIFKGWFIDPFLFFLVFVSVIKKEKHIDLVLTSWLFSGIIVSLISIYYLYIGELTFDGRLHAFYLSPNHLAMYLAPAFLIALFFLNNSLSFPRRRESTATINIDFGIIQNIKRIPNIKYSIFSIVVLIIILIPLYFTYSYGAFLGIFAGVVYLSAVGNKNLFILRGFSRRLRSFSFTSFQSDWRLKPSRTQILKFLHDKLLLAILLSFIFTGFIFISSNKFNQIINSNSRSSFHSRLMIWNVAGEIIKDNFLFGIGPGTFQETYLSYAEKFDEQYLEWAVPQPHNIFLAFYLQTGLIGFIGFVLILIWFFFRRDAINCVSTTVKTIITVLMIYTLIHGLVDTTYWKNDLALMFWLIIGLAIVENLALDKN
ncbi:hypothetical protein GQ568_01535 [Patescibacteria group bacterium]|nr:hypothetical protein [Patescibacteria group bacterium]